MDDVVLLIWSLEKVEIVCICNAWCCSIYTFRRTFTILIQWRKIYCGPLCIKLSNPSYWIGQGKSWEKRLFAQQLSISIMKTRIHVISASVQLTRYASTASELRLFLCLDSLAYGCCKYWNVKLLTSQKTMNFTSTCNKSSELKLNTQCRCSIFTWTWTLHYPYDIFALKIANAVALVLLRVIKY